MGRRTVTARNAGSKAWILIAATLSGLTGCTAVGQCARPECAEDAQTTMVVTSALAKDKEILPGSIQVLVHARVVYLYGIADTDLERFHAETIAKSTAGVSRVVDFIGINNR